MSRISEYADTTTGRPFTGVAGCTFIGVGWLVFHNMSRYVSHKSSDLYGTVGAQRAHPRITTSGFLAYWRGQKLCLSLPNSST